MMWKEIWIGGFPDQTAQMRAEEVKRAFKERGFKIGTAAYNIISSPYSFELAKERSKIKLVKHSVKQMGLEKPRLQDIYSRSVLYGWQLCPLEVALQLRLQYREQPLNEEMFIGAKRVYSFGGEYVLFRLSHDSSGLWLTTEISFECYSDHMIFVFSLGAV